MTQEHPITPSDALVQQWFLNAKALPPNQWVTDIAHEAARWGADQQLEQDATWLDTKALFSRSLTVTPPGDVLRQAMRPKPPIDRRIEKVRQETEAIQKANTELKRLYDNNDEGMKILADS